ncbi:MAG: hypothetical protein GY937_28115 [bacterium]|nr:hypothetical protein [bacterium]
MSPADLTRNLRRVRFAAGALALLLAIHLVVGENPWSFGSWDRVQLGEGVKPRDAMPFVWLASLGNLVLILALGLCARFWLGPLALPEREVSAEPEPRHVLARRILVGAAMLALLLQTWPRMDHSLWVDEEYSARRSILGQYEIEKDGTLDWDKLKWRDTFWAYRQPNNHVPFSIVSRISTRIAGVSRPEDDIEVALRAPALLFGLLALPALAALATRIGLPWAGVLAAWLLVAHPWYVRFASAGRGYSLLLFLLPLYWSAAWKMLQHASWQRFGAFGALQFLLVWSYPAVFLLVGLTNLWLLAEWWRTRDGGPPFPEVSKRICVTALLGAMAFFQVMTPNLIQLSGYMARKSMRFSGRWMEQLGNLFLTGTPPGRGNGQLAGAGAFSELATFPTVVYAATLVILLVMIAGVVHLIRHGGRTARFTALLVLAAPLTLAWAWITNSFIYHQYLVFGLTSAALLSGAGILLPLHVSPGRGARIATALIAVSAGGLLFTVGHPTRRALIELPIGSSRDSVLATRPTLDPENPANADILTVGLGGCLCFYDPLGRTASTPEELEAIIEEADGGGKALFINYGRRKMLQHRIPEALALVERDDLFEPVGEYPAFETHRQRYVRRYRPGTLP